MGLGIWDEGFWMTDEGVCSLVIDLGYGTWDLGLGHLILGTWDDGLGILDNRFGIWTWNLEFGMRNFGIGIWQ